MSTRDKCWGEAYEELPHEEKMRLLSESPVELVNTLNATAEEKLAERHKCFIQRVRSPLREAFYFKQSQSYRLEPESDRLLEELDYTKPEPI